MLEKVFENKIKKLLKEKQAYYVKFFGCGITTAGTPDILACVNGHFIGIECKADNGRLSEMQRLKLKAIQNSGGIGIVAAPCSWYHIVKLINCVS
jgi:Holliday junction resolvase